MTTRDVTNPKRSFVKETTGVNIGSSSLWMCLITHKMCVSLTFNGAVCQTALRWKVFFLDLTEINYIFRLFVVTNSAIFHKDVIRALCQLSK